MEATIRREKGEKLSGCKLAIHVWEMGKILWSNPVLFIFLKVCVQIERTFVAAIHDCRRRLLRIAVRRRGMSQSWVNFCCILSREIISNFLRDEYIHHSSSSKHFPETCWTINIIVVAITRRTCVRKIKTASPACNWSYGLLCAIH